MTSEKYSRAEIITALVFISVIVGTFAFTGFSTPVDPEQTVSFHHDDNCVKGALDVEVADTETQRFVGLSNAPSLDEDEGMLFVFEEQDDRAFVMRKMDFPVDMVFVSENKTITKIYHAPVESSKPLTEYTGQAKWVIETPYNWTTQHKVSTGDNIEIHELDVETWLD